MNLTELLSSPLLLMFCSVFIGQLIGRINYKNFKLGSSGCLFVGIFLSYFATKYLMSKGDKFFKLSQYFIPKELFQLSLIGFIASVGLLASKDIRKIIKTNGFKFMILAFVITFTGALSTWVFINIFFSNLKISIIGTYVGALTSSPGLATAIETSKSLFNGSESMVGLGYSISYIPGVFIVIVFVQLLAKRYKNYTKATKSKKDKDNNTDKASNFNIISFSLVCIFGLIIGKLSFYLGPNLGKFSLGATGGILIIALILGDIKKIGFLDFDMNRKQLSLVRDISLNMFLSIVGINYGYNALNLIKTTGLQLILIGIITASISILIGFFIGKKVLKLNYIYLLGGICGGMTSTPGLAACIESLDCDEVTAGYGATYPFALLYMIMFTSLLFKL